MYFPYFRGRQYELLALKELAQRQLISSNTVIPIVEPIKISSTFNSTLKMYEDNNMNLSLILNPEVGELAGEDISMLFNRINDNIIPAIIINESTEDISDELDKYNISLSKILSILTSRDFVSDYNEMFFKISPKYTLFPDERRIRRSIQGNKVLFEDKFKKQLKNADYLKNVDEFFSEEHLYYAEEGYYGFGDYSIIGNSYEESGFAPRAVAIHIVYFDNEELLRVHHFVSDSNYGTEDVAGKFYEAVIKLVNQFENDRKNKTFALDTLIDYARRGYYPGLPTIKKLSIMHHLELVNSYLSGK